MPNLFWAWRPFNNDPFNTRFAIAYPVGKEIIGSNDERAVCPVCGNGMGTRPWYPPHRIWLTKSNYPDFLYAGLEVFVSGRFRKLYEETGLTGITRFDPLADVARVAGRPVDNIKEKPPQYHYIWNAYDGGDIDDDLSGMHRLPGICPKCRPSVVRFDRVVLKDGSWTGADVFTPYGLNVILVSERFKEMVDRHKFTGSTLVPAEKYQWDSRKPPPARF